MNTAIKTLTARLSLPLLASLTVACAPSVKVGTEVTRFHLNEEIPAQSINLVAASDQDANSLEYKSYADAVSRQLANIGLTVVDGDAADVFASLSISRELEQQAPKRSPVSVGIGMGSYGGGSGVGGSVYTPVGGTKGGEAFVSRLKVALIEREENNVIWEGTATNTATAGDGAATAQIENLASALFSNFPGESGKTVTIK